MSRFIHLKKNWMGIFQFLKGRSWVKWIITIGVLGVSILIPFVGSRRNLLFITMAVISIIAVVILLKWSGLGLLGILVGGYFVNFTGPGGINVIVIGVLVVTGLWIVDMVIQNRHIRFIEPSTTRPVLGLFVGAALSFLAGQLPWYPLASHAPFTAQAGGLIIYIVSGLAFLLLGNIIKDIGWLKAFTWIFVFIGSLYTLGRMVPPVANVLRRVFAGGAFTGSLFFVWISVISFSQAMLNQKLHIAWRVFLFALFGAVMYIAIVQANSWKSGYIPPLAGIAVIVILKLRQKVIWLIPFMIVGTWWVMSEAIATDQYSVLTRWEAWEIVFNLSKKSPIFGMGFGNYYWYTPLTPINGWSVSFNSHSQYVDLFAQTGLVGLGCFFWFFWEVGKIGLSILDKSPEGFEKAYIYGAMGGIIGTLVAGLFADWVLPFVYNIGMSGMRSSILSWFFLGGVVVIYKLIDNKLNTNQAGTIMGGNNE